MKVLQFIFLDEIISKNLIEDIMNAEIIVSNDDMISDLTNKKNLQVITSNVQTQEPNISSNLDFNKKLLNLKKS